MLERKITAELINWKNREDKRALLVKGARQVGKTFIIEKFAKENYKHYININFVENPKYKAIFDGDMDVDTLIKQISLNSSIVCFLKLNICNICIPFMISLILPVIKLRLSLTLTAIFFKYFKNSLIQTKAIG